ncbi:DUF11 domain-containing protein [bacterium]|nr:DUF11 domain-containing protein [bacterium]
MRFFQGSVAAICSVSTILVGISLSMAGDPPAPASIDAAPAGPPPRTLDHFGVAPLPTLTKKQPVKSPENKAAETTPAPMKNDQPRTLPRTLPTASSTSRKPIIDPMVRKVSQSEALVPSDNAASSSIPSTPSTATRGNVIRPTVEVRQIVPPQVTAGTPCPIELTITNQGESAVEKVILTDSIDTTLEVVSSNPRSEQSGQTLVWSLGRLEPKESKRITFSVIARKNAGSPSALARASVSYAAAVESEIRLLTPNVAVNLSGTDRGMVGQPMDLSIDLENRGNSPAGGVILRCILPPGLAHSEGPELEYEVGELAAGEVRNVPLTLTASVAGSSTVKVIIQGEGLSPTAAEHPITVEDYQMALEVEGPAQRYLNQTGIYKIKVTNQSSATVNHAEVATPLPDGLSFAHASDGGQVAGDGRMVRWTMPEIPAHETKELTLTCVASKIGNQPLSPAIMIAQRQIAQAQCETNVRGVAAISVEVADVADPVELNGETIYEIHILNQGTMGVTGVVVTCEIPEEVEATAADGPTSQRIVGRSLTFDPLAELAPNAEAIFRVKCKGVKEGSARFKATVQTEQLKTPINEEESTTIYSTQ